VIVPLEVRAYALRMWADYRREKGDIPDLVAMVVPTQGIKIAKRTTFLGDMGGYVQAHPEMQALLQPAGDNAMWLITIGPTSARVEVLRRED